MHWVTLVYACVPRFASVCAHSSQEIPRPILDRKQCLLILYIQNNVHLRSLQDARMIGVNEFVNLDYKFSLYCLNHNKKRNQIKKAATGWDRTSDLSVNSRALYQLSYGSLATTYITFMHLNSVSLSQQIIQMCNRCYDLDACDLS